MTKVLILAEDYFRDEELVYPLYRMREAGFEVTVAALGKKEVKGKFGLPVSVDKEISDCNADEFDAVIIPGGYAPDKLRTYEEVLSIVKEMNSKGKVIAAICHAGWVIASAGVIKGKNVTSYASIKDDMENAGGKWSDEEVVVDGNLITARKPDDLPAFCREIINKLTP
jgi:protease I